MHENIVFITQAVHLPRFLRTANMEFNNLPEGRLNIIKSAQVEMLLISAAMDKIVYRFPLIAWPFVKIKVMVDFMIRRVAGRKASVDGLDDQWRKDFR